MERIDGSEGRAPVPEVQPPSSAVTFDFYYHLADQGNAVVYQYMDSFKLHDENQFQPRDLRKSK